MLHVCLTTLFCTCMDSGIMFKALKYCYYTLGYFSGTHCEIQRYGLKYLYTKFGAFITKWTIVWLTCCTKLVCSHFNGFVSYKYTTLFISSSVNISSCRYLIFFNQLSHSLVMYFLKMFRYVDTSITWSLCSSWSLQVWWATPTVNQADDWLLWICW